MKKRIITCFAVIMLVAGLSLLLYPTVSDYIHTTKHRRVIFTYIESVEKLSNDEYDKILADAQEYNANLSKNPMSLTLPNEAALERYNNMLHLSDTGIMGYIDIEKADIHLPIYHGVDESVLQVGVGHLEGSSLPVGSETSHVLLSGHRGLPSAKLFTNLDKLEIGDTFSLLILEEAYIYEVDDISVILPYETNLLDFEQGEEYCTLITCTPYGVNSHRLLVRGKRVPMTELEEKLSIQSGARFIGILPILAAVEIPVLLISVYVAASTERKRKKA